MGKFKILGFPNLKKRFVHALPEHADFLWDPEVPADYKGLIDFQFKLTSLLVIHLNIK